MATRKTTGLTYGLMRFDFLQNEAGVMIGRDTDRNILIVSYPDGSEAEFDQGYECIADVARHGHDVHHGWWPIPVDGGRNDAKVLADAGWYINVK